MSAPIEDHHRGTKRIMRYLANKGDYGVRYRKTKVGGVDEDVIDVDVYTDSSFVDDPVSRKSTYGYVAVMADGPMRNFITETGRPCRIRLFIDNQSTIKLIRSGIFRLGSKHYEVKLHWVREEYEAGHVELVYVPTDDQLADLMTKPLAKTAFERLAGRLVRKAEWPED
ncbi:hypothetical protein SPI_03207 [Niveomyces insectorum RCEF 264]|uniref:Uncharacterized protein n=1 Tax=Niveomyces insectorum RCEF 264 TaxID=1081102 RepID=A0A162MNK8_9HYPO|nr:hypothetical protein SPI_03207 [Niveomyces insectorum RCEF 264]